MKHLTQAAACAALGLLLAGPAFAQGRITASLEQPAAQAQFIAAHALFKCEAGECVAGIAPDESLGLSGCEDLVRHVGRVTAYAGGPKALNEKALAKCNAVAKGPSAEATASR